MYLGAQVSIGDQAIIGPVTEIGTGCIVDTGSYVIGSSVLAGSFIGRNLMSVADIVNQNRILNAELSTDTPRPMRCCSPRWKSTMRCRPSLQYAVLSRLVRPHPGNSHAPGPRVALAVPTDRGSVRHGIISMWSAIHSSWIPAIRMNL